jgi:hypothetical protein
VGKSFLHLTLSTVVFNSGETLPFHATGYKTTGQILIPLSKERLDMAAYTFTYHMENGCA